MGKSIFDDFIQLTLCRTISYTLHVFVDEYDNRVSSTGWGIQTEVLTNLFISFQNSKISQKNLHVGII